MKIRVFKLGNRDFIQIGRRTIPIDAITQITYEDSVILGKCVDIEYSLSNKERKNIYVQKENVQLVKEFLEQRD